MPKTLKRPTIKPVATELEVEQGSQEWLDARIPLITASRFLDVLTTIKSGYSAARKNYAAEIVVQRLTGKEIERFKTRAMEWGNETEDLAADTYMLLTGAIPEKCGIFIHNEHPFGDSPDRLVGKDGTLEIKCLNTANHIEVLKTGKMPAKHMPQVQGHLWMTGRKWCDFISFDPDMPKDAQIFIQRIERDNDYIQMLEEELIVFNQEVEKDITFIKEYKR